MSEVIQNVRVPNGCEVFENVAEPYTYSGWAKEVYHKKSGIFLDYVPAGKFKMGTKPGDEFAKYEIQHQVTLTKGFYMGKYPVTMTQFMKVYPKHKFAYMDIKGEPEPINGMVPADHVKWEKGLAYCTKFGFRYPTEAEWEYACRAGGTEELNAKDLKDYAWFDRNSKGVSHPVGLKKANAWGLYDMLGNVEEWCSDWFDVYSKKAVIDPTGPATGAPDWLHVARGGSMKSPDWCTRSAMRHPHNKTLCPYRAGFRVVMDLPEE